MRWYATHTKPRMELWARSNLWSRGFEVYLPQYGKRRRHARKVDVVRAPLFPRYLFVRADFTCASQRAVNTAAGAIGLVAFGGAPAPVPDAAIEEIRKREDETGLVLLADARPLTPGEKLTVIDGPLRDLVGVLVQVTDRDRVYLLLNLFGRQVRSQLSANSVLRET